MLSRKGMLPVLVILLLMTCSRSFAQNGTSMYEALDAGTFGCQARGYYDYRSNSYYNGITYSDEYNASHNSMERYGQPSPDVWYSVTISGNTDLTVSLCASSLDTYVHLVDAGGNEIMSNDDYCAGGSQLSYTGMAGGTYYVVVEGKSSSTGYYNLGITSNSTGLIPEGANRSNAINAGSFSSSGSYSHTMSNADVCLGNDMGQKSNDIYYQFTLSGTARVTLSHCGSGFDTYLHLLNSLGSEIAYGDDNTGTLCPGSQAYLEITLSAGTYYVVSEGYFTYTGSIVTTINVNMQLTVPVISYNFPPQVTSGSAVSVNVTNTGMPAISVNTTTTYAGTGSAGMSNGAALSSTFNNPLSVAVDASGNVYVADAGNHSIRKISSSGEVSTFAGAGYSGYADGTGTAARFTYPSSLAFDALGTLYVTDQQNHRIRKISPAGLVTTLAGRDRKSVV